MARRIGYLASHYPAVSHTFVMREVDALRDRGVHVETLSIHRTPDSELLTRADRAAAESTFAVLPISAPRLMATHLRALARRPGRYLATLARALGLARGGARGLLRQLFYFAETIVAAEHCRERGIDHLHAQFADSASDVAMLASGYLGAGVSWSIAVHGPVEFRDRATNGLAAKVADAEFVQTISEFGRGEVRALLPGGEGGKVHVVHCGVVPADYAPRPAREPDGRFRVVCVGRLVAWKGQSLLVEAARRLIDSGIEAEVELIGDGPERGELERLVAALELEGRVELAGSVGQDRIAERYARADAFCLPSFAEGIPVVLMEAMALELPVVTTRITGVPELVEDGVSGRLVEPGDLDALVAALAGVATDPRRRALGVAGREKVLAEFDVARSAELLAPLFATAGAS